MAKVKKENVQPSRPQFFTAPVSVNQKSVTIKLPRAISSALDCSASRVFCAFVDGVLQVSGSRPNLAIPVLSMEKMKFKPISSR